MKKTVLITGASGLIGSLLVKELAETYHIRALTRHPMEGVDVVQADIRDQAAMQVACQGVDSIIHLAAKISPWETWEDVYTNNVAGEYNVYEAAAQAGVKQVIYASSNHAVGGYEPEAAPGIYLTGQPLLDHQVPVRPDGYYGIGKCIGESMGRYYADYRGLHVICLRIGVIHGHDNPYPFVDWDEHMPPEPEPGERLAAIWLSQRDCVQLVEKCLQADDLRFEIFYGISNNQPHFYDLEHARKMIGYVPQDGADVRRSQQRVRSTGF